MINIHLKYFNNKVNIVIQSILIIVIFTSFMIASNIFKKYSYCYINQVEITLNYQIMVINLTKVIFPLLSSYLFGSSFLKVNDDYRLIIIKSRKERIKYFLSKVFSLCFIIGGLLIICNSLYLLLGYLGIPNFTKYGIINLVFVKIYLISIIYGLLSLIIVLFTDNSLGYILIMICYIIIQILGDFVTFNIFVLPFLKDKDLSINIVALISELIMLLWLNLMRYYYMDM